MKKYRYLLVSFSLFIISLIAWQITGSLAEKTTEMDNVTSLALLSFLGTVVFFGTTLVLLLITIVKKVIESKSVVR
ncbi:hypothetical protein [Falsibacillus pallidus]|uniref:hypothetical protein n=1 Tax=Falsibacillus pallidus TaxID=493781 RepID=UPI003D981321